MRTQLWALPENESTIDFNPPVVKSPSTAEARRAPRSRREKKRKEMMGRVSLRKIISLFLFLLLFSLRNLSALCASAVEGSFKTSTSAQEPQKQLPEKPAVSAQENQPETKEIADSVISCPNLLCSINVSVTDSNNRRIPDLTPQNFTIFEDGVEQQIAIWAHDDSLVNFSLVFNISDYQPLKLMAQQTVRSFVSQVRSTDEVVIPQFKANREIVRDLSADKRKFENALNGISSNNKSTLVSLIAEAVKPTKEKRQAPRNFMVVITDGLSLSGTAADREAADAILRENTPVYFII